MKIYVWCNNGQGSLISPVRTWREALNIIRGQLHRPGKSFLVIKYASGRSWESDSLVIPREGDVASPGDRYPKLCAEWWRSFRLPPGPRQKEIPKPGVLWPCFCRWPGSSFSPQPSAKDWSHSHLLFQDPLCGCARSWALAPFHLFGEDELCQGHANHHLEIIFGHRKLFSSRRWRLHSDSRSETLEYSKQTCQEEVLTEWCPGDWVYKLTFGLCYSERAEAPASVGPALLGQDSPSFTLGWCSGRTDGGKWSRIQKHLQPPRSTWPWTFQKSSSFFNPLLPSADWLLGPCGWFLHNLCVSFSWWEADYRSAACPGSARWALHRHTHRECWWGMKTPRDASLQTEKQTFIPFSLQGVFKFEWLFETAKLVTV